MTDITHDLACHRPGAGVGEVSPDATDIGRDALLSCIELFFFAYRDFTGDPDEVLAAYGFGRAHHRVLHFVHRNPGIRVADLLDILRITKQSLARVLKQLVDEGYIVQRTGAADRRERLLRVTPKGARLADKLADLQSRRVAAALAAAGPGSWEAAKGFLLAMISEKDRARVQMLAKLREAGGGGGSGSEP